MKGNTKQTFRIFWQHIASQKLAFFVIVLSIILASIANVVAPLYFKDFFDILTQNGQDSLNILFALLVKILIVYLLGWFFWRIATFTASWFQPKMMADLASTCFDYLHRHSISFFNNNFVGSLVKKVNRFSRAFDVILDIIFYDLLQIFTNIIFIIIIIWQKSLLLAIGILVWVVIYCLINYYFSLYKLKFDLKRSEADSEATGVLADTITNQYNIKLFTSFQREKDLFKEVQERLRKLRHFCWNLGNIFEAAQALLMVFLEVGIFYVGLKLWQQGKFTIGDFVLIHAYVVNIFHRLWNFGRIIRTYYENLAEANEMTEILERPHDIRDVNNAKKLRVKQGRIVFDNVSFSYHQTRRVLFRLNLSFAEKKKTALVGPSGSGKSTLVNLLLRNYDLGGGKIYIDGQKISSVTQDSLRSQISLVPQEPILFHRTLMENIRYGKPEASDQEVVKAAKMANCHDFITSLPDGYETYVGERGVKLSGGERQRVAIARAILKNAPILVLDEATSSLDSASEELIQAALDILMKGKTVIVIAHRLSTIMKMDNIIVLQEGKFVEQGSHQKLLAKKDSLYKTMWQKQIGGFIR